MGTPVCFLFHFPRRWQPLCPQTQRWGWDRQQGSCWGLGSLWGERKVFLPLSLACEHCGALHLLLKCSKHNI